MRITVKGQVTIPRHVRRHLGVRPHDEVDFIVRDGNVVIERVEKSDDDFIKELEVLRGSGHSTMTTDEIMALTRGDDDFA